MLGPFRRTPAEGRRAHPPGTRVARPVSAAALAKRAARRTRAQTAAREDACLQALRDCVLAGEPAPSSSSRAAPGRPVVRLAVYASPHGRRVALRTAHRARRGRHGPGLRTFAPELTLAQAFHHLLRAHGERVAEADVTALSTADGGLPLDVTLGALVARGGAVCDVSYLSAVPQ